jgi:lipopolysaccharide transport system ATP-binding protein
MSKDAIVTLKNVGLWYKKGRSLRTKESDKFWALKDVSMNIYHGETLGLLGRNGAGKSTILRVVAGIILPNRGTIENNGYHAELLSVQAGFNMHLSGRQNILLSGILMGMTRKEILAQVDYIIDLAGLGDFVDEPVSSYSSGMRTRLGFCTAFAINPDILLIDEVLGVGDAKFAEKSAGMIKDRIAKNNTAVIVSHSEHKMKELCDRVIWIDDGGVRAEGTPDEIWPIYRDFYRAYRGLTVRSPAPPKSESKDKHVF